MNMVAGMARPDQLATPDGSVASKLVWDYFDRAPSGVFVDVGAGHPVNGNQTWFLEQQGWRGVLIEPHAAMAALLREKRPGSRTFQTAAGRPEQVGWTDFYLGQNRSSPRPDRDVRALAQVVRVPVQTLDSMLEEAAV